MCVRNLHVELHEDHKRRKGRVNLCCLFRPILNLFSPIIIFCSWKILSMILLLLGQLLLGDKATCLLPHPLEFVLQFCWPKVMLTFFICIKKTESSLPAWRRLWCWERKVMRGRSAARWMDGWIRLQRWWVHHWKTWRDGLSKRTSMWASRIDKTLRAHNQF